MCHDERRTDASYTCRDEAQRRLDNREALVGLEVVGCEEDVVVEGAEEEHHDEQCTAKSSVVEDGDLHERSSGCAGLEVPLPKDKDGNDEDADYD